ncbi:MFS general substrate transporter [Sporormia fimetaria CBS 119925]|uniref:MFS general substrate transporter n=1 Tax=Sporormia fimetaria CBS 119925 TaxID=1340428 RepID=A0A6A6VAT8_9PLEO|nr:MFS general substrate transporter [Sporormia fimetaria CBS 119925]
MASTAGERQPLLRNSTEGDGERPRQISAHEVTQHSQEHPDYPIDKGYVAWTQVVGGFILFANSWGLPNAFGVFQTHYVDSLMPGEDTATIAWIGSIQLFFTTLGCLPGGLLIDRGYLKSVIAVGTVLEVIGLVISSFFKTYWAILLSQGVCMGIGSGLLALLPVAVLAMFFEKKRMLATGLASTGASVAGVAYSLSMRSLFVSIGFAWAVRILALIILVTNAIAFSVMRLQLQYGSKGSKFGLHHFKDLPYTAFVVAFTLFVASSFVPFFFVQEYALQLGLPTETAFNLLTVLNVANVFGRFVPNFIADRYGGVNTLIPLTIACIITMAMLPLATNVPTLMAFSVVYGFLSGGVIIIPGPTITDLSPSTSDMGARLGLAYLVAAFGGLLGNPVSAVIKGDGKHAVPNFSGVWFCGAGVMAAGLVALIATRWLKLGSLFAVGRV